MIEIPKSGPCRNIYQPTLKGKDSQLCANHSNSVTNQDEHLIIMAFIGTLTRLPNQ